MLCQWAKHVGATVIGSVGSVEKAALAQAKADLARAESRWTAAKATLGRVRPLVEGCRRRHDNCMLYPRVFMDKVRNVGPRSRRAALLPIVAARCFGVHIFIVDGKPWRIQGFQNYGCARCTCANGANPATPGFARQPAWRSQGRSATLATIEYVSLHLLPRLPDAGSDINTL